MRLFSQRHSCAACPRESGEQESTTSGIKEVRQGKQTTALPDDNSKLEPPDSISNSVVKRLSADGSVGLSHVRVGHCQAFNKKASSRKRRGFFIRCPTIPPS